MPRILLVESVKYLAPDGTLTTLDPAAYELDPTAEPGLLMPAHGTSWPATRVRPGARGAATVDPETCTGCGACVAPCPVDAIALHHASAMEALA